MLLTFLSSVTQLPLSLFDPMDYSPPGSSVHGILQARILEWVAISFSTLLRLLSPSKLDNHSGHPSLKENWVCRMQKRVYTGASPLPFRVQI